MSNATQTELGALVSLWRYPVKSMMGEELHTAQVTEHGLLGDRVYALLDSFDGKVVSAKNPRKWPGLFAFRATFIEPPGSSAKLPPVRITLANGTIVTSKQSDLNRALSKALNGEVTLAATERGHVAGVQSSVPASWTAKAEEYWPDLEGLDYRDTVTDFALPTGTFFDSATVHLLTTATLNRLGAFYPQGRFAVQRFRPNIVVEPASGEKDFVENAWIGHTLAIGDEVRLSVTGPCPRCVMTTLDQGDLPKDGGILRTAVQHNKGNVGVYATVVRGGTIRRGDRVRLGA
ncbi:MAG TPA: MOSC domain-containing protein [Candidatus Binatia bacterium]|nr:MOSC domain-containing protein [Candidatus Binatia bacterium]